MLKSYFSTKYAHIRNPVPLKSINFNYLKNQKSKHDANLRVERGY
jgi:hypothetical protein